MAEVCASVHPPSDDFFYLQNLDCIVHPDSMYVKDADGKKHLYTKNNHRTKLYDKVAASPAAAFEPVCCVE